MELRVADPCRLSNGEMHRDAYVKSFVGEYEISVAMDNRYGKAGKSACDSWVLDRGVMRVFKGDEDVTHLLNGEEKREYSIGLYGDPENIAKAILWCEEMNKEGK